MSQELKVKFVQALKGKGRIILAFDSAGVHLRKTLCTIHRLESGEVYYHTKPIASLHGGFRRLITAAIVRDNQKLRKEKK